MLIYLLFVYLGAMRSSYAALIRLSGNQPEFEKAIKNLAEKPNPYIQVVGTWTTIGRHDAVVLFSAEDNQAASEFVGKNLRTLPGVTTTETLIGTPQAPYTPKGLP